MKCSIISMPISLLLIGIILFTISSSQHVVAQTITKAKEEKDQEQFPTITLTAPKNIKKFLKKHFKISDKPITDVITVDILLRRAQQEIGELLATKGYFSSIISFNKQVSDKNGLASIEINVDPGPRTKVSYISIEFRGELAEDFTERQKRIKQLRADWSLKIGEPFRSSNWEDAKTALLYSVTSKDYAAAHILKSQAEVDPVTASARLTIIIDSGPAFYFGALKITGLERYDETLVRNFATFRSGDPYRLELLHSFQIALQNIPHFNSVSINTQPDVMLHKAIPVQVVLTETQSQRIAFGLGYSTNTGARGELNYNNYNFLDRALNVNSTLRIEQKRQTFFTSIATMPDRNKVHYSLDSSYLMTDIKDLRTIGQKISLSHNYLTKNHYRQLSLSWQREKKRPSGSINQINKAVVLDWHWRYHEVDDPLNIQRGHVTEVRIGGAVRKLLSDQNFLRTYARHQIWWPITKNDVIYLRGELGYTLSKSSSGIPQEYLFRAGGTQSVRGYSFLSLGVREGNAIVGGRVLATGTLEYTRWLTQNWGAALFTDIGSAANSIQKLDPSFGYGAGVRWRSPAGPLALDLARGDKTGKLHIHFSMAVAF